MWLSNLRLRTGGAASQHAAVEQVHSGSHHSKPAALLPPQQGPRRKTLVLDLDRTLIDCILAREFSQTEPDFVYTDEQGCSAKVWLRPFLKQFLTAVARDFEVVLFTAAGPRHADCVLRVLDPQRRIFSHRLYGHHTRECAAWGWVKDLSRLGRPLSSTLLVDDSLLAGLLQPCNLVPIRPFVHSDPRKDFDTALTELLRFLQDKILPAPDVRHMIGLHWHKLLRRPRKQPLHPHPASCPPCGCSCHLQLSHMLHASAPLTTALVAPGQPHPPQLPIRASLVPAHTLAVHQGAKAGQNHGSMGQAPADASQEQAGPAGHQQCPAVAAGCGCMCPHGEAHHVLTAVTIWHRLSQERGCGHMGEEEGEEDAVCQCCDHGLPVLCPGMPGLPGLRSHSQVDQPAQPAALPADTAALPGGGAASPVKLKAGLHRSRTDWQLSSRNPTPKATAAVTQLATGADIDAMLAAAAACGSEGSLAARPPEAGGTPTPAVLPCADGECTTGEGGLLRAAARLSKGATGELTAAASTPTTTPTAGTHGAAAAQQPSAAGTDAAVLQPTQRATSAMSARMCGPLASMLLQVAEQPAAAELPTSQSQAEPDTAAPLSRWAVSSEVQASGGGDIAPAMAKPLSLHRVVSGARNSPFSHPAQMVPWQDEAGTAGLTLPTGQATGAGAEPAYAAEACYTAAPGYWYTGEQYAAGALCYSAARMQWERVGHGETVTEGGSSTSSSTTTRSGSSMLSSVESGELDTPPSSAGSSMTAAAVGSKSGSNGGTPVHRSGPAGQNACAVTSPLSQLSKSGGGSVAGADVGAGVALTSSPKLQVLQDVQLVPAAPVSGTVLVPVQQDARVRAGQLRA